MVTEPMRRAISLCVTAALFLGLLLSAAVAATPEPVRVYFFWAYGCPYCEQEKVFLDDLLRRHAPAVEIVSYEVSQDQDNQRLLQDMGGTHGFTPTTVPVTFIGGAYWRGYRPSLAGEMEAHVLHCRGGECPDIGEEVVTRRAPGGGELASPGYPGGEGAPSVARASGGAATIHVPFLGTFDLGASSLVYATAVIAFVDGFNPCSLWVLSMLLAIVTHTNSRRKIFVVGGTFLLVTSTIYGAFVAGMFNVLAYLMYIGWVTYFVAAIAIAFAAINIKDYFFFRQGVSLTISDKHKPGIFKQMRGTIAGDKSTLAMMGATAVMAAGITVIELPCTAGFPLVWSGLVASHQVGLMSFAALLVLYIAVYLSVEIVVFAAAVTTLKMSKFQEMHGRVLKLVGGTVMLFLGIALVADKEIMSSLSGTLAVFGLAAGTSLIVLVLHRLVLPRWGVFLGSGKPAAEVGPNSGKGRRGFALLRAPKAVGLALAALVLGLAYFPALLGARPDPEAKPLHAGTVATRVGNRSLETELTLIFSPGNAASRDALDMLGTNTDCTVHLNPIEQVSSLPSAAWLGLPGRPYDHAVNASAVRLLGGSDLPILIVSTGDERQIFMERQKIVSTIVKLCRKDERVLPPWGQTDFLSPLEDGCGIAAETDCE